MLDKDWLIANGAWNGDCAAWQNYYATEAASSPIAALANGTGPFMLDYWTPGVEIALKRNPAYWRTTPLWAGGPAGPAALERLVIKTIADGATRSAMLINGEADWGNFSGYEGQLADYVLLRYGPDGQVGALQNLTGTLRSYTGILSAMAQDAFFTYDIDTSGPRNYVGSGALDGNGIPPDFFADIHVRKAFNYAFNWTQYITDVYGGQAIQRTGPFIKGIIGYTETQPTYFYSPTLALQEFGQAWGGQVMTNGFVFTLTYNTGNTGRQKFAEILKAGIEALNPAFHVNVVELTSSDYNADNFASRMPLFRSGWIQDIPHPHNWARPYLSGDLFFSQRQRLPPDQTSLYQTKINTCLALSGEAARTCYEAIQVTTYLSVTDIFLAQGLETQFVRAEVRGYYANLALINQPYFYALSKGPLPVIRAIPPGADQSVNFSSTLGATATFLLPAGTVTQTLNLIVTPDVIAQGAPVGYRLGNLAFELQAHDNTGALVPALTFSNPITLTLYYNTQATGPLIEDQLRLLWLNGNTWEEAACGPYVRDLGNDRLQVPLCHFSKFALGGISNDLYLPLVRR